MKRVIHFMDGENLMIQKNYLLKNVRLLLNLIFNDLNLLSCKKQMIHIICVHCITITAMNFITNKVWKNIYLFAVTVPTTTTVNDIECVFLYRNVIQNWYFVKS